MWHRHHQNPKTDSLCCNNHVGFPIKIKLDPESSDIIRNKMGLLAFISLMQSKKVVLNELKRTPDQQIQLKQWKQYKKKKVAQWGKEWYRIGQGNRRGGEHWEKCERWIHGFPNQLARLYQRSLRLLSLLLLPFFSFRCCLCWYEYDYEFMGFWGQTFRDLINQGWGSWLVMGTVYTTKFNSWGDLVGLWYWYGMFLIVKNVLKFCLTCFYLK